MNVYAKCLKRGLDFFISLTAIVILSPIMLILTLIGTIVMVGNPFFIQERPGKNEKIFKLIKFRSMTMKKGKDGKLLPDDKRLTKYGKFIRKTSLDELPELINICKGDMAIVGPRPLLVRYLPYYTKEERKRHSVRPGLTGLAQVNGRNAISWEKKFQYDLEYVNHITMMEDIRIVCLTVKKMFMRPEGVVLNALEDFDEYRQKQKV